VSASTPPFAAQREDRGDVDDRPAARRLHRVHGVLAPEEDALEVHRQDPIELGLGGVEELDVDLDRRVVDQHVQAAELAHRGVEEGRDVGLARDVGAAVGAEAGHRRLAAGVLDVAAENGRAFGRERARDRAAQSRGDAGHHRAPSVQSSVGHEPSVPPVAPISSPVT
jgi:hypothetical protein